ncbi:unnamed protein product [Moneuplotes crassus]|uniref:Superoxide dismutase [Cu-Zn] n=1 Tax=Euplotes crassus TaxID=5936 RepID=A0AAD1XX86_EUPCR|nr:unnamed protein product [Moneuplotes crassus]
MKLVIPFVFLLAFSASMRVLTSQGGLSDTGSQCTGDCATPVATCRILQNENGVDGLIRIEPASDGSGNSDVYVELSGLTPGEHGFHVHESPITGSDCESAGGHFNPTYEDHGDIDAPEHHVGDLGNIEIDENGNVSTVLSSDTLTLSGPTNVVGRSIVVHGGQDDLGEGGDEQSLANGNSGPRVGCCTITLQGSNI